MTRALATRLDRLQRRLDPKVTSTPAYIFIDFERDDTDIVALTAIGETVTMRDSETLNRCAERARAELSCAFLVAVYSEPIEGRIDG